MQSRSVSITGATGFVGWHIAEAFRDAGWQVRAIVRPDSPKPLPSGVERVVARLSRAELVGACDGSDAIVHSAGLLRAGRPEAFARVNVDGTRAVVAAANQAGARLVHISSQAAIGPSPPGGASDEDDPPHPITPYGQSKWDAEEAVRQDARGAWTILRPVSVYGPRDRQFLPLFRLASRGHFLLAASAGARFSIVHVQDVARAALLAADAAPANHEACFVANEQPVTTVDLLKAVAVAVGRPYRPTRVPAIVLRGLAAAGEIAWRLGITPAFDRARFAEFQAGSFVCSTRRATDALGFTAATPLAAGLGSTWEWYRTAGWV